MPLCLIYAFVVQLIMCTLLNLHDSGDLKVLSPDQYCEKIVYLFCSQGGCRYIDIEHEQTFMLS